MAKKDSLDSKQYNKVPPHDANAEKSVLGGILIDPSSINSVLQIVGINHFYFDNPGILYVRISLG